MTHEAALIGRPIMTANVDGEVGSCQGRGAQQRMAAGQLELGHGLGPSGPLPITSSRMSHLVDAL